MAGQDAFVPAMDAQRDAAVGLETLVADDLWPTPQVPRACDGALRHDQAPRSPREPRAGLLGGLESTG